MTKIARLAIEGSRQAALRMIAEAQPAGALMSIDAETVVALCDAALAEAGKD